MNRREILGMLGKGGMVTFIAVGTTAAALNPPRVEIPQARLDSLQDLVRVQSSEGNWNYDPYMFGLANGLLLAQAVIEGTECKYFETPPIWQRGNEPSDSPAGAVERLSRAFKADPDYALGWQANVACAAMDEGLDPAAANRAAWRFMRAAFGISEIDPKTIVRPRNQFGK